MPTPSDDQPYALLPLASRKWRTAPHVQDRLGTVADLRQRGLSQLDIAGQLGVSASTISRDLSRLDLVERHQHDEVIYTEHLQSLVSLSEVEQACWAILYRYRDDPDHAAKIAAAAETIVNARKESRLVIAAARDPYAAGFDDHDDDDEDEDEDDNLDAQAILDGLRDDPRADSGGSELSKLRRGVETHLPKYISPKKVAIISRGLAIGERAERDLRDASPADEAPGT